MVDVQVTKNLDRKRRFGLLGALAANLARAARALVCAVTDAAGQRRNFILWPFVMIAGLVAYRLLPGEPDAAALIAGIGATIIFAARARDTDAREPAFMALVFAIGMALLPLHGTLFGTPMLESPRYGTYEARIDAVISDDGQEQRWILSNITGAVDWTVPDIRLARVSVSSTHSVSVGDGVSARIRFYPVPPPAVPGGYDSQFVSYFDGIGAYGTVLGDLAIVPVEEGGLSRLVDAVRGAITARVVAQLGDRIGGIAAALIAGDQSRISDDDYELMAEAGIVHVISISGLHLTLVAGTMFAAVRLLLSLSYTLPQRVPIKKVAAAFGIVTAIAYMLLSGMVIPAVRSTIMLALVFAATMAGRQALTMRNVAIAGLILIVCEPSSVFRASFQLSFAAVVALIAAYEIARQRREDRDTPKRAKIVTLVLDVAATSIIAGLATVVFTAFHFQQTAPFGVLGNLMVMPIVSFVMMPAALFGTLLIPVGLDAPAYAMLGWSIEAMLWCATFVRDLSGGFDPSPILSPAALVITLVALAWLAYFRGRLRLLGPIFAVPAIALFCIERAPDIFIADWSKAVAVRSGDTVALIAGRNNTFATDVWSERYITEIADAHEQTACDDLGCILQTDEGYMVALIEERSAFDEDCRLADIVISRIKAPPACEIAARLVIDATDLARHGTHMIDWNGPEIPPSLRVAIENRDRPWRPAAQ